MKNISRLFLIFAILLSCFKVVAYPTSGDLSGDYYDYDGSSDVGGAILFFFAIICYLIRVNWLRSKLCKTAKGLDIFLKFFIYWPVVLWYILVIFWILKKGYGFSDLFGGLSLLFFSWMFYEVLYKMGVDDLKSKKNDDEA